MKRKTMSNTTRDKQQELDYKVSLIEMALSDDCTTKKAICKYTKFKLATINAIFRNDKELYAKYCIARRTLVDLAADNVAEIVADQKHPKNYNASIYVLQNYTSDLDDALESKKLAGDIELEISANGTGKSNANPIKIVLGKRPDVQEEE